MLFEIEVEGHLGQLSIFGSAQNHCIIFPPQNAPEVNNNNFGKIIEKEKIHFARNNRQKGNVNSLVYC